MCCRQAGPRYSETAVQADREVRCRVSASIVSASALQDFEPNSDIHQLHFTNGDTYEGETLADLRHGKGVHKCSNGDSHDGFWYKGMRHGHGRAHFARGFSYEGDFEYDHAQGTGKAKYENGAVYDGEFQADQRSGWGVQCFPDESIYVGEWEGDKMAGMGRLTARDGSFFHGSWRDGSQQAGRWVSGDGREEYSGNWAGLSRHGSGTFHVEGVCQYTGDWQDDKQHGQGKCRWADGSAYSGGWRAGLREGTGVMVQSDGYKYDGEWLADRECGAGNARLANGSRYTGEFANGKPHGQGRLATAGGERFEGAFVAGKRHGHGRCVFPSGDKYEGEWVDDKRHGEGTCQFSNGTLFRGSWQNGEWLQTESDPSLCVVAGAALALAVAGQDASFGILAKDERRNRRLAGGDKFVVWLEGPATVLATVTDNADGTYKASYTATQAGIYDLYITNDTGESVAESPYPLRIMPAKPDPRKSTVSLQASAKPARVGRTVGFRIEARDAFGNRCKAADLAEDLPIELELARGPTRMPLAIAAPSRGCYACSFVPAAAGFHRLSASSGGVQLLNSPVSIEVRTASGESVADARPRDEAAEWAHRAAAQYAADGDADGWSSDASCPETAEQKYIRENPNVPVVSDMADMWKVAKLQRERKQKEAAAKAVAELAELKGAAPATEASFQTA